MDEYVEQTTTGLGSRLWSSIKGIVLGVIFFIVAFPVLWFNEGYAVKTARSLSQGAKVVVDAPADRVDPANEGKLVHVTGKATTGDTVADPMFGVSANTIKLRRKVEMYQWKETKTSQKEKNVGGSETTKTTYTYEEVWSEQPIHSAAFKQASDHQNPEMQFSSTEYFAGDARLGRFKLTRSIVSQITGADPVDVSQAKLPDSLKAKSHPMDSGFEIGDPDAPKIGDLRVTFQQLTSPEISVVSRQVHDTFEPYRASSGGTVELVSMGIRSSDAMFASAKSANVLRTWLLRGLGFVLMFAGMMLVFSPLATLGDVVPFFGSLMRAGAAIVSGLLSLCLSMAVIAVAWIAYRPLVAGALLLGGLLCAYWASTFGNKKALQGPAAAAPR